MPFDFDKQVVFLEMSSFIGISIGAQHHYGKIWGYIDGEHECFSLEKVLTKNEARALSKYHLALRRRRYASKYGERGHCHRGSP